MSNESELPTIDYETPSPAVSGGSGSGCVLFLVSFAISCGVSVVCYRVYGNRTAATLGLWIELGKIVFGLVMLLERRFRAIGVALLLSLPVCFVILVSGWKGLLSP